MRFVTALCSFCLLLITGCGSSTGNTEQLTGLNSSDTGRAVLEFTGYEHNFGKVAEGERIGYVFEFQNKGTSDLVIISALTTCGCTVPKYDRKPIKPGKHGKLEVIFDTSGRSGVQTKTVTVRSNATNSVVILRIVAEVETDKNQ